MSDARRYAVWLEPCQDQRHSREVDRQSPTGLIFKMYSSCSSMAMNRYVCVCLLTAGHEAD